MIKLNNKNITYVALADSNNSLKAPKEIWYADSSNSVKLVYRRKDALIEGVDYEKYHWLNGRNGAYINTEHLVKTYEDAFEVYAKYDGTNRNSYGILKNPFGIEGENIRIASYIDGENCINAVIKQNESYSNYNIFIHKDVFKIALYAPNSSEYVKSLDGISYTNPIGGTVTNNTNLKMYVFARNGKVNSYFDGDISYFKITDPTFVTDKLHLIPCKLLKPVPKWLDANGIRRNIGECGMIDLVSGKFYGNVNSVGTFTVENYYERKEWLQGRNGAYIDTNYYPIIGTDIFSVHFHYDGTIKNPNGSEQDAFGVNYIDSNERNFIRAFINKGNHLSCSYYKYTNSYPTTGIQSDEWNIDNLLINDSKFQYIANGTSYSFNNNDIKSQVCPYTLFVFRNNDQVFNDNNYLHGDISSFKITDTSSNTKMNLIPCTLTMDLPASMDANNIARTKGTSGMWDLVSDRFYGNVANSGTFKAVNLAEGVDYEVHDWLQGRNGAYIDTLHKIKAFDDKFEVHYHYDGNIKNPDNGVQDVFGYASENNNAWIRHYITSSNYAASNYFKQAGDWYHSGIITNDATIELWADASSFYYKVNDNNFTFSTNGLEAGEYPNCYVFACNGLKQTYSNRYFHGDIAYFKITDSTSNIKMNLIPVKLLRSIPSKYDANGIARQAGECGMYDTVNDKFYGNVANSGSFTVSDDN